MKNNATRTIRSEEITIDVRICAALAANRGGEGHAVQEQLVTVLSGLAAWADYPEEDLPEVAPEALQTSLQQIQQDLQQLLQTRDYGRILKSGVLTVIAGKPNVGKSTLFNLLSGCERSIVTEIAGTTRDVVEELKEVGIRAEVNATDNYNDFLKRGDWDIYAKAFVAAPTGDPQYYFTTHVLDSSSYNSGHYHNERVEDLTRQLRGEFDPAARSRLAVQISQQLLDDNAFIYASHLKMSFVMKSNIKGFTAHPSDYYEITSDLEV